MATGKTPELSFSAGDTSLNSLLNVPDARANMTEKESNQAKKQVHLILFLSAIFKEYTDLLKELFDEEKIEKNFLELELNLDTKTLSDIYLEGKNLQTYSMLLGFATFAANISSEWIGEYGGFDINKTPFFSQNLIDSVNHYAGNYVSKPGFQAAGSLFKTLADPIYQQQEMDNRVKTSRLDPEVQRISGELSKTSQEVLSDKQGFDRAIQQYAELAQAMARATGQAV